MTIADLSVSRIKTADKCGLQHEAVRAWLAAIVDAEGCILITRVSPPSYGGQHRYRVGLEVVNTDRWLVEAIRQRSGHGVVMGPRAPANVRCRATWKWAARADSCRQILPAIAPWLVAKFGQAELALEVLALKGRRQGRWGGYSAEQVVRLEHCATEIRALKRV